MAGGGYIDPYGFSKSSSAPKPSASSGSPGVYIDPYRFRGGRGGPTASPAKQSHGGSIFGWLGQKTALAGHDIAQMPGGVYQVGKAVSHDAAKALNEATGNHSKSGYGRGKYELPGLGKAMAKSTLQSFEHPLRDPFQTALNIAPGIGVAGKLGEAGLAARAADVASGESRLGEAAKAFTRGHGNAPPRVLKSGGRVVQKGDTTMRIGSHETNLIPSRNAGVRLAQRGYDSMVQRALDREAQAKPFSNKMQEKVTSRVAEHGQKRIGGAKAEEQRAVQRMNAVPADKLDRAALHLSRLPLKMGSKFHQAALELTATQTPAEEASAYHFGQEAKFREKAADPNATREEQQAALEAADRNQHAAKLYQGVANRKLVHTDLTKPNGEKVFVNPAEKRLAAADAAMKRQGEVGEAMIQEHNLMSQAGQDERINAPARVRAGAEYNKPTPGKLGEESPVLKEARAQVAKLEKLHAKASLKAMGNPRSEGFASRHPLLQMPWEKSPVVMRLSGTLSVAKDRLQSLEAAHANRIQPTGLVGGEQALSGRTFIPYRASEKVSQPSEVTSASGKTVGVAQSPIDSKAFTGENIRQGLVPKNVTASASRHYRQIAKFVNTDSLRRSALETSSPIRRSTRDILIRVPEEGSKPLSAEMKQLLGSERSAVHDESSLKEGENAGTQEGLRALHQMFTQNILDMAEPSKAMGIGAKAQKGYRWVDEHLVSELQKDASPKPRGYKSKIGSIADNTNSAVTAMTVYFKVGHVFTRALTNAATNIMQGSLRPDETAKSFKLWKQLTPEEQARAVGAAGQQGFAALPHEGSEGLVGRAVSGTARGGARFWARHFDAPFRFNSLAHELRKIGYDTPEKVRTALDAIQKSGNGMPAHEWSKVSAAFRRADREAISYDRLNEFEKKYLTRAIWFYPWVKGSSLFTVRSILEHPYKMSALGAAGVQGRKEQQKLLGDVPSYEQGLIALGGGKEPSTVDMSTFSPMATLGQLANIPTVPGGISQQFNPVLGAGVQYATGTNQYGEPSNNPLGDAANSLIAPTPEAQVADAFRRRHKDTSNRMFPGMGPLAELERYGLGPGFAARRVNKAALAKAAAREKAKRYTIYGK